MDTLDIAVRLGAATLVGVLLGLNRDLHGKQTGVRTLGLVCLGSALAVLSIHAATGMEESRVIQGQSRYSVLSVSSKSNAVPTAFVNCTNGWMAATY